LSINYNVETCPRMSENFFNFEMPSMQWTKHCNKFETKYGAPDNLLCKILAHK